MAKASESCSETAYGEVYKFRVSLSKSTVAVSNNCVDIGCLIFIILFVLTHFSILC